MRQLPKQANDNLRHHFHEIISAEYEEAINRIDECRVIPQMPISNTLLATSRIGRVSYLATVMLF
jgi:hypothetical protein